MKLVELNRIARIAHGTAKKRRKNGAKVEYNGIGVLQEASKELICATAAYSDMMFGNDKKKYEDCLARTIICVLIASQVIDGINIEEALIRNQKENRKCAERINGKV